MNTEHIPSRLQRDLVYGVSWQRRLSFMAKHLTRSAGKIVLIAAICLPAHGQESNESDRVTVSLPDQEFDLTLIRLQRLNEIAPPVTGESERISGFNSVASYLCETEMSLAAVKATLSPSAWKRYADRVLSLTGTDGDPKWGQYRDRVREGSSEYPAIHLGIPEIVEICTKLEKEAVLAGDAIDQEMEDLLFRIPSRMEWQFAARTITDKSRREEKLHFDRWVSYSQNLSGRIEDIQEKIGDPANAGSVADQQRFIMLINRALERDDTRNEAAEILGEILQASLRFEPNIGKAEEANLWPIVSDQPNAWGFHRMLGNAPEWVMTADSLEQLEDMWSQLRDREISDPASLGSIGDRDFGILMGGHFISLTNRSGKWIDYSIDGGSPVSPSTHEPEPYKVRECIGDDAIGVEDGRGGLRVLMVRGLNPNWLVPFRRNTFLASEQADVNSIADQAAQKMKEILPDTDYQRNARIVEAYRTLTSDKENFSRDSWQRTIKEVGAIEFRSVGDSKPEKVINPLLAAIGASESDDKAAKDQSSRADFFEIALQLASAESQTSN